MALAADVSGHSGRTPCVVDARLALSRHGQLSVTRLARDFAVWLPQELHRVLSDTRTFLEDTSQLTPSPYCASLRRLDMKVEADQVGEELSQWDRLPYEDDLAALPLYYLGERADECFTPPGTDRRLRDRYEQLQRGVHLAMRKSEYDLPRGRVVANCIADAVALCAALEPYGGFILTRLESDSKRCPALCDYLDAWGVPTTQVEDDAEEAVRWLSKALARSGLGPIGWAGVALAAVHVIVPGFPVLGGADRGFDDDGVARLWERASVFWHRV